MTVTALAAPTFLSAKVPVPEPVTVTASLPNAVTVAVPDSAAAVGPGGALDDLEVRLRVDVVRAGGGGQIPAGVEKGQGEVVELPVADLRGRHRLAVLGERGRVEVDDVEPLAARTGSHSGPARSNSDPDAGGLIVPTISSFTDNSTDKPARMGGTTLMCSEPNRRRRDPPDRSHPAWTLSSL